MMVEMVMKMDDTNQLNIPTNMLVVLLLFFACSFFFLLLLALNQGDVLSFEQNAPDRFVGVRLHVIFGRIFQHQIHVLVEADDVTFDAHVDIFIQPNLNLGSILQISEDQIDGLHHNLLDLLRRTFVRHLELW